MSDTKRFLDEAIALAFDNVDEGGRPFGAVVVKDGAVVARGVNRMAVDCDPTAHAELLALRAAGKALGAPRLDGCAVYASGQPCPMCFAAMRMCGIDRVFFAYSNDEAEPYGLSTASIAAELARPVDEQEGIEAAHIPQARGARGHLYETWLQRNGLQRNSLKRYDGT